MSEHHHEGCSCHHHEQHHEGCSCGHHHEHHHEGCGCGHHHEHHHEGCGCGHDHANSGIGTKQAITVMISATILFVAGIVLQEWIHIEFVPMICFGIVYLLTGWRVLLSAGKNIIKGYVLDENFLMSIATIAAFVIGDFAEAAGIMMFFYIGELFEERAVTKSRKQIMDAADMRPDEVYLIKDRGIETIEAKDAAIGDIILVRVGDRVPLDGIVIEGQSFVDTSAITGEPVPVRVGVGDQIVSGYMNTTAVLKVKVEKELKDSMVTRILHAVENAAAGKPKIDRFITKFARYYTPFVVCAAVLTAVVPSLMTGEWGKWIYTAITFLVISCPCALVLSVPLAFFAGIGTASKEHILFKSGLALEVLQQVKAVVFDKTGTLTNGTFDVQKCVPQEGYNEKEVLRVAAECEYSSSHPIAVSIIEAAKKQNILPEQKGTIKEYPGLGVRKLHDGKETLCGNKNFLEQNGVQVPDSGSNYGGTEVFVAYEGRYIGFIQIADALKSDAVQAVRYMNSKGLHTAMLTGDTKANAKVVAMETGIQTIHAGLLPEEKLEKMKQIREEYGKVLFVGDGINDAPVLAGADLGAAMGSGADAAIEAADVVFMTSSLEAIPRAIRISKITNRIAIQNVVFALTVKALVMLLGFVGVANMWFAVFADTGVAMLCVLNSIRVLKGVVRHGKKVV